MKALNAGAFICLFTLFVACSAPDKPIYHDVTYEYDVDVDFNRIKTYNWVKMPATSRIDEFNQIRIKRVVNAKLKALGLKVKIDNPDIFLVMYGGGYKAVDMTVMMDYAVYDVGRLKLAMYDAESHNEIWWAEARADLFFDMTPAQKDEVIETSVQRILEYYPPRP
ncbi:hypothetical protein D1BOALGB6SA_3782 [Olavius sp. associated proteobacterium Delta 1]|nr:hypothetical protein D1BOALGB6SA_3782 [Olavius sp. associated proteobacterium Delta 1]